MEEFIFKRTASLNPGNSGGILIRSKGDLIGINTWIHISEDSTFVAHGFALPSNDVKKVVLDMLQQKSEEKIEFGIRFLDRKVGEVEEGKMGIVVKDVSKKSAFYKVDLRIGDFIRTIDGNYIDEEKTALLILYNKKDGEIFEITYERDGKLKSTKLAFKRKSITINQGKKLYGMQLIGIAKDLDLGISEWVYVDNIYYDSKFFKTDLSVGDIIVNIGSMEIKNTEDIIKSYEKIQKR